MIMPAKTAAVTRTDRPCRNRSFAEKADKNDADDGASRKDVSSQKATFAIAAQLAVRWPLCREAV